MNIKKPIDNFRDLLWSLIYLRPINSGNRGLNSIYDRIYNSVSSSVNTSVNSIDLMFENYEY